MAEEDINFEKIMREHDFNYLLEELINKYNKKKEKIIGGEIKGNDSINELDSIHAVSNKNNESLPANKFVVKIKNNEKKIGGTIKGSDIINNKLDIIQAFKNKNYDSLPENIFVKGQKIKELEKINFYKLFKNKFWDIIFIIIALIMISSKPNVNQFPNVALINSFEAKNIDLIKESKDLEFKKYLTINFYIFSLFAYKQKKDNDSISFPNWDIINYGQISGDNYFWVLKNDQYKKIIVGFPGTIGFLQLISEVLFSDFVKYDINNSNILINNYFGSRTLQILDLIFTDEIINLLRKNYQIVSTGHSLGGAMAQTFMYFAIRKNKIDKNKNNPMIITYSQPKAGNQYFVEFLEKNCYFILRSYLQYDIVPRIPFCNLGIISFLKYLFNKDNENNKYMHTIHELIIPEEKSIFKVILSGIIFLICFLSLLCYAYLLLLKKWEISFHKNFTRNIIISLCILIISLNEYVGIIIMQILIVLFLIITMFTIICICLYLLFQLLSFIYQLLLNIFLFIKYLYHLANSTIEKVDVYKFNINLPSDISSLLTKLLLCSILGRKFGSNITKSHSYANVYGILSNERILNILEEKKNTKEGKSKKEICEDWEEDFQIEVEKKRFKPKKKKL